MADWNAEERRILEGRWVEDSHRLRLRGACPWCLHDDAFDDVVVYDESAFGLVVPGTPSVTSFPPQWNIRCGCKDPAHGDASGCGREGAVRTGR